MPQYRQMVGESLAKKLHAKVLHQLPSHLHPESFVLLSAQAVEQWKQTDTTLECAEEQGQKEWDEACFNLEELINDTVPASKQFKAKSLCKELLKNSHFCLETSGRTMHLMDKPKVTFSVLDYILVAVRQAGPSEILKVNYANYKLHRLITKYLLHGGTPAQLLRNKILLAKSSGTRLPRCPRSLKKQVQWGPDREEEVEHIS